VTTMTLRGASMRCGRSTSLGTAGEQRTEHDVVNGFGSMLV